MDRSKALARLRKIAAAVAERPEVIDQARADGCTWEEIAEAANMSRAGVIKLWKSGSKRA